MRSLVFQHTEEEGPGTLELWFRERALPFHVHHWYRNKESPDAAKFDCLVILGGPMNVNQEAEYPWLSEEKSFLRNWIEKQKPVLGICLGGQMLAQALGGTVSKNPQREIGFHTITRHPISYPAFRRWPKELAVYQYHEDTFSIPPGCENLAFSEACPRQAFSRGNKLLGLQFHPESTENWIRGNAASISRSTDENFVQNPEETELLLRKRLPPLTENFFLLMDDFVGSWR